METCTNVLLGGVLSPFWPCSWVQQPQKLIFTQLLPKCNDLCNHGALIVTLATWASVSTVKITCLVHYHKSEFRFAFGEADAVMRLCRVRKHKTHQRCTNQNIFQRICSAHFLPHSNTSFTNYLQRCLYLTSKGSASNFEQEKQLWEQIALSLTLDSEL